MSSYEDARRAMAGLPPEDQMNLVTGDVLGNMPVDDRQHFAAALYSHLSAEEQRRAAMITVLAAPSGEDRLMTLWRWVLIILGVSILFFGGASLWLLLTGRSAEGMIALVSLALGAVAGLLAPSPTSGSQTNEP